MLRGSPLTVTDPDYKAALESALAPLADDPRVTSVSTPFTVPTEAQASYISRDQHEALVIVALKDSSPTAKGYIAAVLAEIHPGNLTMLATGGLPISEAFKKPLEGALQRAEYLALPFTLLILVLIFASRLAA